ncbi:MAG: lipoprotein-anchoring transpeptidase ErfK/SrfK [Cryomorphaceae bacterium]|jgi:lipoprotein-anchoring transpeptidase ErfK/SrfK
MKLHSLRSLIKVTSLALISGLLFTSCGSSPVRDRSNKMIVSVKDQTMLLTKDGEPVKAYRISTSKFGLGNTRNSKKTPLGKMEIARKIGGGSRSGTVFKSRRKTGEVLKPNTPGRDPIVTRIMWLKGNEYRNRDTYARYIYIHGTPEEFNIGKPVSYGCIRMKSRDIIDLYSRVGLGAEVKIISGRLYKTREGRKSAAVLQKAYSGGA